MRKWLTAFRCRLGSKYDSERLFPFGGIQLLRSHLGGEMRTCANRRRVGGGGGGVVTSMRMRMLAYKFFLIEPLVHKLLTTVTIFFLSFIKIPALLKVSVLRFNISRLCLRIQINYVCFGTISLKYVSHLIALSGCFRLQAIFYLSPWKFFAMIKTRGVFRSPVDFVNYVSTLPR